MDLFRSNTNNNKTKVGAVEHAEARPKKVARSAGTSHATAQKVTEPLTKESMTVQAVEEQDTKGEHETTITAANEEAVRAPVSLDDEERFLMALLLWCGVLGGLTYVPT